jgi:prolyl oligopeptidase PreP (S9A serine peptidase family)
VNKDETKRPVTSKDSAKVPMFLVHKKRIVLDGNNPTPMYGYGGFNIATTPASTRCGSRCSKEALVTRASTARRERIR